MTGSYLSVPTPASKGECASGEEYEKSMFYESGSDYQEWLLDAVTRSLGTDKVEGALPALADVGGGTGNFTADLRRAAIKARGASNKEDPTWVVADPVPEQLALVEKHDGLVAELADAVEFAQGGGSAEFDLALIKEVIHLVDDKDLDGVFAGIFRRLRSGGRCLVVTRPQEVDYPLPAQARAVWKQNQPPAQRFVDAATRGGFKSAVVSQEERQSSCDSEQWCAMIRARFWSTFTDFSDEDLERGVQELLDERGSDTWEFKELLCFIVMDKP
eukprot:CAMPEP_0180380662 /NCGR_PEP_ID=MMETSP0989-20121125/26170_1 /TAXON_ID=697907 /ORGANISM="non described non described, Strain CCMP2293" /LENGTH=272 /DNA_ID=CAMNT_0022380163 /DNA_START=6 /DNA_END=824 /DNA_ORIENTATION=-